MRFTQVKLVTKNPERLTSFYGPVFGCEMLLPLTLLDEVAAAAVGAPGSSVGIVILSLPGLHDPSLTLELYTFLGEWPKSWNHRPGQGHLTFVVDNVDATADKVVEHGGARLGTAADWTAPSGGRSRFVFVKDPDGNVVDLLTHL